MAVSTTPKLDARKLREDFPIFEQLIHDQPLAYLDTAASAQKPRAVLEAMSRFYETSYANIHRGVYDLGERATEAYEGAREKARGFVQRRGPWNQRLLPSSVRWRLSSSSRSRYLGW